MSSTTPNMEETPAPFEALPEDTLEVLEAGADLGEGASRDIESVLAEAFALDPDSLEAIEIEQDAEDLAEVSQAFETRVERMSSPYVISPELEKILRVSRILHKPLLLEGEPGTGKTSLAYALAGQEDMPVIHCRGKSTLTAQSVMYEVDYVARLNDASLSQAVPEAMRTEAVQWTKHIEEGGSAEDPGFQSFMSRFERAARLLNLGRVSDVRNYITYGELGEAITRAAAGEKVILLFDEIDKAKRDFPNDLLDELEHLTMRIRETGEEVSAPRENLTVLITSNHERDLPDPFLRRCVYSYLEFPKPDHMTEIVMAHFPDIEKNYGNLLRSAVAKFYEVRGLHGLEKEPSTSEMLDWIRVLIAMGVEEVEGELPFPEVLVKTKEDLDRVRKETGYESFSERDMRDYEYLEAYKMESAAYEALNGAWVFRVTPRNDWIKSPDPSLYVLLANEGIDFSAPNEDSEDRTAFSINEPGFKWIDEGLFSVSPPEGLDPSKRDSWIERSTRIYKMMLEKGFVASQFVVSEEPKEFAQVVQSNPLFTRGVDPSGVAFYRTKEGKYVYEQPLNTATEKSDTGDTYLSDESLARLRQIQFEDEE